MMNGLPDESTHCAFFYNADQKKQILSLNFNYDELGNLGNLYYSGQANKNGRSHGNGKYWDD